MTSAVPSIEATRAVLVERLLEERTGAGIWEGELSSSALSTATAATALSLAIAAGHGAPDDERRVREGLAWLAMTQNADGGFGDTVDSPSNVSTTVLAWVALARLEAGAPARAARERASAWITERVGPLTPAALSDTITAAYGDDRTFAVPILTMCALGGVFGDGPDAWRAVPAIPFELAALPGRMFRWLGLPMVSYALPALIAIGQVIHHHRPTRNPLARMVRRRTRERTLAKLRAIQPSTGGFLEATPLTSFVAMSLVGLERGGHPVVAEAQRFLRASQRADGSWPIDTNLSTWVTSLAVDGLAAGGSLAGRLDATARQRVERWLLGQQYTREHPYTLAAPGGWAWTDLAGGVPDADDTPAALLALRRLGTEHMDAVAAGVRWLAELQNRDGGIPTFCKGWGKLPFDRSSPDLTAHTLRAWDAWEEALGAETRRRIARARARAIAFLVREQREDGAWVPLWFGNQADPALANPLYGTTRVLKAAGVAGDEGWSRAVSRGVGWTLAAQDPDGGWGGAPGLPPSIEETALALDGLGVVGETRGVDDDLRAGIERGAEWLVEHTAGGRLTAATPIGLYFAKLWYSERLYPLVFATAALERATRVLAAREAAALGATGGDA